MYRSSLGRDAIPVVEETRPNPLETIAAAIPPSHLLRFTRILSRDAGRRLDLARICADRIVAEGRRGNVDFALNEFRWGR